MQPVRAEIERHAEQAGVGDAAAADARARLEQRNARLAGAGAAGGGDAGGAGADNNKVDIGLLRPGMDGGRRDQRGGTGEKRAAAKPRHGIRMIDV